MIWTVEITVYLYHWRAWNAMFAASLIGPFPFNCAMCWGEGNRRLGIDENLDAEVFGEDDPKLELRFEPRLVPRLDPWLEPWLRFLGVILLRGVEVRLLRGVEVWLLCGVDVNGEKRDIAGDDRFRGVDVRDPWGVDDTLLMVMGDTLGEPVVKGWRLRRIVIYRSLTRFPLGFFFGDFFDLRVAFFGPNFLTALDPFHRRRVRIMVPPRNPPPPGLRISFLFVFMSIWLSASCCNVSLCRSMNFNVCLGRVTFFSRISRAASVNHLIISVSPDSTNSCRLLGLRSLLSDSKAFITERGVFSMMV